MATREIKTALALDGETKLKDAIKNINKEYTVLKSEMGLVTAQFGKNNDSVEKLAAVNDVLNKQIDTQKSKVAELENGLSQAKAAYGENSNEAKNYEIQLNNNKATLAKLENELRDNEKAIEEQGKEAAQAADKIEDHAEETKQADKETGKWQDSLKTVGAALGGAFAASAKAAAVAVGLMAAAMAGAVVGLAKLGNDYNKTVNQIGASTGRTGEQLEELGEMAKTVYGNNFGESLEDVGESLSTVQRITGLWDENLQKATESGIALRDTFGFELEESSRAANALMTQFGISAEEAYDIIAYGAQEGANRNGDMLDTINEYSNQYAALGLDAEQFITSLQVGAAQGAFSIDKVGDAVKEFNIRAKDGSKSSAEAFSTLGFEADEMTKAFASGGEDAEEAFFKVVKSLQDIEDPIKRNAAGVALFGTQFEDLESGALQILGSMGDTSEYVEGALQGINDVKYNDLGTALEGIKRTLEVQLLPIASSLATGLTEMSKEISTALADGFQSEDIQTIGTMISEKLLEGVKTFSQYIPAVVETVTTVLTEAVNLVVELLPELLPVLLDGALQLVQGVLDAIKGNIEPLMDMVVTVLMQIVQFFVDNLPMVIEIGVEILMALINGLVDAIPQLIPAIVEAVITIVDTIIGNLSQIIAAAIQIILAIVNGLIAALPQLIEWLPTIVESVVDAIIDNLPLIIDAAIQIIVAIVRALIENLPLLAKAAIELVGTILNALVKSIPEVLSTAGKLGMEIVNAFKDIDWKQLGVDMIMGIANGLSNAGSALADAAKKAANGALNSIKKALGIASPSRVFRDEVGLMMGEGIAVGLDKSSRDIDKAFANALPDLERQYDVAFAGESIAAKKRAAAQRAAAENSIDYAAVGAAVKEALAGMGVQIDGTKVGQVITAGAKAGRFARGVV